MLAAIDHAGIVRPIDHGKLSSGELWHATEYVPGRTLTEHVEHLDDQTLSHGDGKRSGKFPFRPVLDLFRKVCEVVEAAHRAGVIHRDLKPSNIIIDPNGSPHLLDFGVAKSPSANDSALVTHSDQFLGTAAYASPEQVEARPGFVDVRSDIYSLGVILYQLLTARFPYKVDGPLAQTFDNIRHADPLPPRSVTSCLSSDLQAVMLKALAKEPARRYQTVAEFREDIERYIRGLPVRAKGDGRLYILFKFIRRNRVAACLAGALVILTAAYAIHNQTMNYRIAAERAEAIRKYRMALQSADFIVAQIDEQLRKYAGMGEIRRKLLKQAYDQYAALAQEHTDIPELQADQADVLVRLGDISRQLGNVADAEARRREALVIRQHLADMQPNNPDYQADLSIGTVLVGDSAKSRSDISTAKSLYKMALDIDERLAAKSPDVMRYQSNLLYSYLRLGNLAIDAGYCIEAHDYLENCLRLATALADRRPDDPERLVALVECYGNVANFAARTSDHVRAHECHIKAERVAARLTATDPRNTRYQRFHANQLVALGYESQEVGDLDMAENYLQAAMNVVGPLFELEPYNLEYRSPYQGILSSLASIASKRGDSKTAFHNLQRFLENAEHALAVQPDSAYFLNEALMANVYLASWSGGLGDAASQRRFCQAAIEAGDRIANLPDASPGPISAHARFLAECPVVELRDINRALSLAERAVRETGGCTISELGNLGIICKAAGQPQRAAEVARRILQILPPESVADREGTQREFATVLAIPSKSPSVSVVQP